MSKDSTSSANIQGTNLVSNQIIYKNENISSSIHPELVKRVSLHPTIVGDTIEDRVFYSLHNDAGQCVYISPHISLGTDVDTFIAAIPNPLRNKEIYDSSDNIPDIIEPGIVQPPTFIPPSELEEDTNVIWPAFLPSIGGGGSPSTEEEDNDPDTSGGGPKPRTNFNNYADDLITSSNRPVGVKCKRDIYRFYESTSYMTTAVNAMSYTRDRNNTRGCYINASYAKLINANKMYYGSRIEEIAARVPSLYTGVEMFAETPYIYSVELLNASNLVDATSMCENSSIVKFTITDSTKLANTSSMFKKCKNLKSVTFSDCNSLTIIDNMFQGCDKPKTNLNWPTVNSAKYALSETNYPWVSLNMPDLRDASYMCYKCPKLKTIKNSDLDMLTNATGMFRACPSLVADENAAYNSLTIAKEMYMGCKSLKTLKPVFAALRDGEALLKNCFSLTDLKYEIQFPLLETATSMCENCYGLTSIETTFYNVKKADCMFRNCKNIKFISISFPLLEDASEMFSFSSLSGENDFSAPSATLLNHTFQCVNPRGKFVLHLDIKPLKTTNMFASSGLSDFDGIDYSDLTVADGMFYNCKNLKTLRIDNAAALLVIDHFCTNCSSLVSFYGSFGALTRYTEGKSPFKGCYALKTVEFYAPLLTNGRDLFTDAKSSLETVKGNLNSIIDASGMYDGFTKLTEVPDMPSATELHRAFANTAITSVPNIESAVNAANAFNSCLDIKGNVDMALFPKLQNGVNMFHRCNNITSVNIQVNEGADVRNIFGGCTKITSVTSATIGKNSNVVQLLNSSKVDAESFKKVYNALAEVYETVATYDEDSNIICTVGVNPAQKDILLAQYSGKTRELEGNQYAFTFTTLENEETPLPRYMIARF